MLLSSSSELKKYCLGIVDRNFSNIEMFFYVNKIFAEYHIYGNTLTIRSISAEDDGFYQCVAKSNAGQAMGSRRLTVRG